MQTTMHSSMMRTVRWGRGCLPGGGVRGVCPGGWCLPTGVSAWGGVSAQGGDVCRGEGSAQGFLADTPPCEQNHKTGVKTLPCRNYVADGNNKRRVY